MSGGQQKLDLAKAKAWLKKAADKTKAVVLNKTPVEVKTEEATNKEKWGPHGQILADLALACHQGEAFQQCWGVLAKRLAQPPSEHWRQTYKALLVVQHLLVNSSQFAVQHILDNAGSVEALLKYEYKDEAGKDHGINVRNRSKELLWMMESPDRIRDARAKAKAARAKFAGTGRQEAAAAAGGAGSGPGSPGAAGLQRSRNYDGAEGGGYDAAASEALAPLPAYDSLGASPAGASASADPVAATAERIRGLKAAGQHGRGEEEGADISFEAFEEGSAAGVEHSTRSAGALPSLRDLADASARRGNPKRLSELKVNASIASSLGGLRLGGAAAPVAAAMPTPPAAAPPAPGSPAAMRKASGGSSLAVSPTAGVPKTPSSGPGSPLAVPSPPQATAEAFSAFGAFAPSSPSAAPAAPAAASFGDDPFAALDRRVGAPSTAAFPAPASPPASPPAKPTGAAVFSLNAFASATAAPAGSSTASRAALPDVFAQGAAAQSPATALGSAGAAAKAAAAHDAFADFNPFSRH